ncbi:MAG: class I SAM-dependent methyltransferase [Acidobacteria bacterium]|nr:class I SAM-dependent methyltransferase [Acidobacteriota bacterium]
MKASGKSEAGEARGFRDPGGRLMERGGRLLRVVGAEGRECARLFLEDGCLEGLRKTGRLVETRRLTEAEAEEAGLGGETEVLEHRPVWFPSYPAEWAPEMLAEAGRLTLEVAEAALRAGAGLKDATPYNVMYEGWRAVFLDALSVEPRGGLDPLWRAEAQFRRTFLYPLAAAGRCGVGLKETFGVRREGPEPEELAEWAGPVRRWLPPFLGLCTLPAMLNRSERVAEEGFYEGRKCGSEEQARFILERRLRGLRKQLEALAGGVRGRSKWSGYQGEECHYAAEDLAAKDAFVREALGRLKPGARVLDVGANLGRYSLMAAEMGHSVVAIDADAVVMGRLYEEAKRRKLDVLPLVVDFANPPGGTGWGNRETKGFLERAEGQFDCVLMLAVMHHLELVNGVPAEEVMELVGRLTRGMVVVEWVGPEDAQYRKLLRGRKPLCADTGHRADLRSPSGRTVTKREAASDVLCISERRLECRSVQTD